MTWYTYIAQCNDGSYYTGVTTDIAAREKKHNDGTGAKYTRSRKPVRIIFSEKHISRSCAQKREAEIKQWTKPKKQSLIQGKHPPLCESLEKSDHKNH